MTDFAASFQGSLADFYNLPASSRMDYYRSSKVDPIEYLSSEMRARGWRQTDMVDVFGTRARANDVLRRRRGLSQAMIRVLVFDRGLSAELLIGREDCKKEPDQ